MEAASGLYEVPIVFKKHIRLTALWALRNLSDKGIGFQIYNFVVSNYAKVGWLNLNRPILFTKLTVSSLF